MIKALVLNRLRSTFGSLTGKNKKGEYKKPSAAKLVLFGILYLYLAAVFIGMAVMISVGLGISLIPIGASWLYFGIMTLLAFSLIFFLSIFETKSELFECKDNELLLSMPIKSGHIVISRIVVVLIYNYIIELVLMLPAIAVYAVISGGEPLGIIGGLATSAFTPIAATALSSFVGYAIAELSKRIKNKTFINLALSLGFIALYFWGYEALMSNVEGFGAYIEQNLSSIAGSAPVLCYIGKAAMLSPLPLIVYCLCCSLVALLTYLLIARRYIAIITVNRGAKRSVYKASTAKKRSALIALSRKEFSRFTSSATYMINTAIGCVFEIAIAVFALVKRGEIMSVAKELPLGIDIAPVMIATLLVASSAITISSCALSLEGKSLWILRSMPINGKDVLISKTVPHILVSAPFSILSSLVLAIGFGFSPLYIILALLLPLSATVLSAILGVVMNVAFPKFVYENEAQPIKQSASTGLTMLILMAFTLLLGGGLFVGAIFSLGAVVCILELVLLSVITVILYFIMIGPCVKKYETLNA